MKQTRFWLTLLLVNWLLLPATVWGEPPTKSEASMAAASATAWEEPPATFGPIITDTAVPPDVGSWAIQPTFAVSCVVDSFSPSWQRESAGGDFTNFSKDIKLTYGPIENMEVFIDMVTYTHNWASDVNEPGPGGERSADFGGIGDLNLTAKYQLVAETATWPTITALGAIDFPTGHFRHLKPGNLGTDELGGGAYTFTLGLNTSKWIKPFYLYGNLWYSMPTDFTADGEPDSDPLGHTPQVHYHPRDFVTLNLAAEWVFTEKWIGLLELTSTWDAGRLIGPKPNMSPAALVSVLPGIEYMAWEKLYFALGVNIDVAGKETDAAVTPIFSFVYEFN
ncbi:MAG: transporter [Deltaproteobacteria bacterium]|nr:transporter [Deltaproteobacteria bacterium]MBW1952431.1 transporter [Deltaproteobacteria bacterium]MBW1986675.1 transporter [Deltaproteobacteria bacterium]MBW2134883.1 transporter [Deltaproteobacteria bacterium]